VDETAEEFRSSKDSIQKYNPALTREHWVIHALFSA